MKRCQMELYLTLSKIKNSNISVRPRLPRSPFSGDPLHFQLFWEIFDSSTHENTSASRSN